MNICHVCGMSRALCGHPEWGWVINLLRRAVVRCLLGWLLGGVAGLLPLSQTTPLSELVPKTGAPLTQVMAEVEWVRVREVITLILVLLL